MNYYRYPGIDMVLIGTDEPALDSGAKSTSEVAEKQNKLSDDTLIEKDKVDDSDKENASGPNLEVQPADKKQQLDNSNNSLSETLKASGEASQEEIEPLERMEPSLEEEPADSLDYKAQSEQPTASNESAIEAPEQTPEQSTEQTPEQSTERSEPEAEGRSALVAKVLQKARDAAQNDQRTTGATPTSRLSTDASGQRSTGATRIPPGTSLISRSQDQRNTGATKFTDQRSTGSTRFNDQRTPGSTGMFDQRSTGANPSYDEISATGTFKSRSLIGRPVPESETDGATAPESDDLAPERSRKSLTATIEIEKNKSKRNLLEKLVSRHPIMVGVAAFCLFVLPVFVYVMLSQSPSDRVAYRQTWGKDVKIIAAKLGKHQEYKGHKAIFYANRADVYMKSEQYGSAIADLKIARELEGSDGEYNLKLSDCYLQLKDFKNAVATAADAVKSNPDNIDALLLHAKASYLLGNKLTALDDYFKASKLEPSNTEVFMERGNYYLSEKKPGSAAADFKHALALSPDLVEAKQKLAACTAIAPVRRIESSESSDKLSPTALKVIAESDFTMLCKKGYDALKKGDNLFAITALSRAVSLNPNNALVREYLAHAFLANGQYAAAISQFDAWDKIARLKLPEKLAFAARLPEGSSVATSFYEQIIQQHSADYHGLVSIANAARAHQCNQSFNSAIQAGLKVGTPAEINELQRMKVASENEAKDKLAKMQAASEIQLKDALDKLKMTR